LRALNVSARPRENPGVAPGETLILAYAGAFSMVDVDSALLSVRERDNWRRRMEVLERSLADVRAHRRRLQLRLRRVRKELARLQMAADAVLDLARPMARTEAVGVSSPAAIHNR
jgi:hypothetical protein